MTAVSLGELVIDLTLGGVEEINDQFDELYDHGLSRGTQIENAFQGIKGPDPQRMHLAPTTDLQKVHDLNKVFEGVASHYPENLHLSPTVNLRELHELNSVFESKRVHKNTIQAEWNANPLTPKVDRSELDRLEKDYGLNLEEKHITLDANVKPSGVQQVEIVNKKDSLIEKVHEKVLDRGADLIVEEGGKQFANASKVLLTAGIDRLATVFPVLKLTGVDKKLKAGVNSALSPLSQSSTYTDIKSDAIHASNAQLVKAYSDGVISQGEYTEAIITAQQELSRLSQHSGKAGITGAISDGIFGMGKKIAGIFTTPAKSAIGGFYEGVGNAYGETFAAGSMKRMESQGISVEGLGEKHSGGIVGMMTGSSAINAFTKRLNRFGNLQEAAAPGLAKFGIGTGAPTFEDEVFEQVEQKVKRLSNIAESSIDEDEFATRFGALKRESFEALKSVNDLSSSFAALSRVLKEASNVAAYPKQAVANRYADSAKNITFEEAPSLVTQPINNPEALGDGVNRVVIASAGFAGAGGTKSQGFAQSLREMSPSSSQVVAFENAGFDTKSDAELNPAGWAVDVLEMVSETIEKGFNPEAVRMALEAKAYVDKNPGVGVDLVGHSAGGLIAKEAQAILKQWGIEARTMTMGTPNFGEFKGDPSSSISLAGESDPLTSPWANASMVTLEGDVGHGASNYLEDETGSQIIKKFLNSEGMEETRLLAKELGHVIEDASSLVAKFTTSEHHRKVREQIPVQARRIKERVDSGHSDFDAGSANAGFRPTEHTGPVIHKQKGHEMARVPSVNRGHEAEQITAFIGGFGGVAGMESEYMGRDLAETLPDHLVVAIESPEFEVAAEEGQTVTDPRFIKKAMGLMTGGEDGRNVVAERTAERLYKYHLDNPDKPINIVGQSGGGMPARLAHDLLKEMGVEDVRVVTAASPHMGATSASGITMLSDQDMLSPASAAIMSNVVPVNEVPGHTKYFDTANSAPDSELNYKEKTEKGRDVQVSGQVKEVMDTYFDRSVPESIARENVKSTTDGYIKGRVPGERMMADVSASAKEASDAVQNACDGLADVIEQATNRVAKAIASSLSSSDLTTSAIRAGLSDFGKMSDEEIAIALATSSSPEAKSVVQEAGEGSLSSATEALSRLSSSTKTLRDASLEAEQRMLSRPEQATAYVGSLQKILPDLIADIDAAISLHSDDMPGISKEISQLGNLKKQVLDVQRRVENTAKILSINELAGKRSPESEDVELGKYKNDVESASKRFYGQLKEAQSLMKKGGDANIKQARAIALELIDAEESFKEAMDSIAEHASGAGGSSAKKKVGTAKGRITRAVKDARKIIQESEAVGKDVGAGYNKGLESDLKTLQGISKRMGALTIEALRDELQTRSPSKKSMAVGKDVGRGYWIGLEEQLKAAGLSRAVREKLLAPLKDAAKGAADASSSLTPSRVAGAAQSISKIASEEIDTQSYRVGSGIVATYGAKGAQAQAKAFAEKLDNGQTFSDALQSVRSKAKSEFTDVTTAFVDELANAKKTSLAYAIGMGASIGQELGQGIASGLRENSGIIQEQIKSTFFNAENVDFTSVGDLLQSDIADIKKAGNNLGKGLSRSFVEGFSRESLLAPFIQVVNEMGDIASRSGPKIIQSLFSGADANIVEGTIGKYLSDRHKKGVKTIATGLAQSRAKEVIQSGKKRGTGLDAVDRKELFIVTGGYGDAEGRSGARIVRSINNDIGGTKKGADRKAIHVRNEFSDISSIKATEDRKMQMLLSLSKAKMQGYSEDAVEMAAQAIAAIKVNPEIEITFVGESGGGFVAEEAQEILESLGHSNSKYIGVGTPQMLGALRNDAASKIASEDDPLMQDLHEITGRFGGYTRPEDGYQEYGVSGHTYEYYKAAGTPRLEEALSGGRKLGEAELKDLAAASNELSSANVESMSAEEFLAHSKAVRAAMNTARLGAEQKVEGLSGQFDKIASDLHDVYLRTSVDETGYYNIEKYVKLLERSLIEMGDVGDDEIQDIIADKLKTIDLIRGKISNDEGAIGTRGAKYSFYSDRLDKLDARFRGEADARGLNVPKEKRKLNSVEAEGGKRNQSPRTNPGRALMDGLVEGIKDGASELLKAVRAVSIEVLEIIKKAWKIASPSKEGKWLGLNLLRSMALGMQDGLNEALDKAEQSASAIILEMKKGLSSERIESIGGDLAQKLGQGIGIVKSQAAASTAKSGMLGPEKFISGHAKTIKRAGSLTKTVIENINSQIKSFIKNAPLLDLGIKFSNDFIKGTRQLLPSIKSSIKEVSSVMSAGLSPKLDFSSLNSFEKSLKKKVDSIRESAASANTKIQGLTDLAEAAMAPARAAKERFVSKFKRRVGQSGPAAFAEEHVGSVKTFGEVTLEALSQTGIDNIASPPEDLLEKAEQAKKELNGLRDIGVEAFASIADSARNYLPGISGKIDDLVSLFRQFGTSALSLVNAFVAFQSLKVVSRLFNSLARQGIEAAMAMEDLQLSMAFASGGSAAGIANFEMVRQSVKELRGDLLSAASGFTGLAAASKGTTLEGAATNEIFEGIQKASIAYQLKPQEQERAFLAVQQIISKNTVSAEELRQQLGEALPGAFQIAARSMGMTTQELNKLLESGQLTADEFLPRFAQQLSAETGSSLGAAAKSTQASINNLNTSLFEFRSTLGEPLLPVKKLGLDAMSGALNLVVENAGSFMKAFSALTLVMGAAFVQGVIAAGNAVMGLLAQMGVLPVVSKVATTSLRAVGAAAKQALVATAGFYAVFETVQIMKNAFSDGGSEIRGFAESAKQSLQEYKQALLEARDANVSFAESLPSSNSQVKGANVFEGTIVESLGGKGIAEGIENAVVGALNVGIKGSLLLNKIPGLDAFIKDESYKDLKFNNKAERDAYSRSEARNELLTYISSTDSEIYSLMGSDGKGGAEVKRVQEIDEALAGLQMQRRSLNPDMEGRRDELDAEIDELLSERALQSAPISKLQQLKQSQVEDIKSNIEILNNEAINGEITGEEYRKQLMQFTQELENSEKMAEWLGKAIEIAADEVLLFARESQAISATLAKKNHDISKLEAQNAIEVAELRASGVGEGVLRGSERDLRAETALSRIDATEAAISSLRSKLTGGVFEDVLQNTGTASSYKEVFSEDVRLKAERMAQDSREQKVLAQGAEDLARLEQLELEQIQLVGEVSTIKAEASEALIASAKEVRSFYENIQRDADAIALDTESARAEMDVKRHQNKLKSALIGFQDSFIDDTVDGLIGLLDTLNQPLQDAIASEKEILNLNNQMVDQRRQANELERSLPSEMLSGEVGQEDLAKFMSSSSPFGMNGYEANDQGGLNRASNFEQSYGKDDPFSGFNAFKLIMPDGSEVNQPLTPDPISSKFGNNNVSEAMSIAEKSHRYQVTLAEERRSLAEETAQIEASMQANGLAKQFEQAREAMNDMGGGLGDQFEEIRRGLGVQNPTRELENALLDLQDKFTETNQSIDDFEGQLENTIQVASQEIAWINGLVASGQMSQSFADTLLPEIEETITVAQSQLSNSNSLLQQNRDLLTAQRTKIVEDFERQEEERRRSARQRINEGAFAIADAFDQIQGNPLMTAATEAQRLGHELENGVVELDEMLRTGQITNDEYQAMRGNLEALNQVKLDGITSEFERLDKARRRSAKRRLIEQRNELENLLTNQERASPFSLRDQRQLEVGRIVRDAQSQATGIGLDFDQQIEDLKEAQRTGEITKNEFVAIKANLIDLNEMKLDGLKQQFQDLLPTVDSITSALSSAKGQFDDSSFDQIKDNIKLAEKSGALTREQAREAREGLLTAERLGSRSSDRNVIQDLMDEENPFVAKFLSQGGRGDLVGLSQLGIQNRQAREAEALLSSLPSDPKFISNQLDAPDLDQDNDSATNAFLKGSDRMVSAMERLTDAIAGNGSRNSPGVKIGQQVIQVTQDEEAMERKLAKKFNALLDQPI